MLPVAPPTTSSPITAATEPSHGDSAPFSDRRKESSRACNPAHLRLEWQPQQLRATTAAYGSPYIMRVDVTNASGTPVPRISITNHSPINTIPAQPATFPSLITVRSCVTNSNSGIASNVAPLNSQDFEDQPIQLPGGSHSIVAATQRHQLYLQHLRCGCHLYNQGRHRRDHDLFPMPGELPISRATVTTASSAVGPTGTMTSPPVATLGTTGNWHRRYSHPIRSCNQVCYVLPPSHRGCQSVAATYSEIQITPLRSIHGHLRQCDPSINSQHYRLACSRYCRRSGISRHCHPTEALLAVQFLARNRLPPGVSCTPNPLTIAISGTAPVTAGLTVMVAGPSTTLSASRISDQHPLYAAAIAIPPTNSNGTHLMTVHLTTWWSLSAVSGVASVLLLFFPGLRPRNQLRSALGLGLVCVLSFTLGCGGGSSSSGGGGGTQVASHTSLTVTNAKQASNNNFAFNVTVTSSGASPTGQVQLFDGSTALGLPVPISNGTASINTGLAAVGTHGVSAHYLGNATTLASASGAINLTVTGATIVPLTSTPNGSANINLTIQ